MRDEKSELTDKKKRRTRKNGRMIIRKVEKVPSTAKNDSGEISDAEQVQCSERQDD